MPITLPENLPAFDILRNEGVMVMSPDRAARQDIRPLRIALLNLMPKKIQTENQFARLIGATPLQINLSLIRMSPFVIILLVDLAIISFLPWLSLVFTGR